MEVGSDLRAGRNRLMEGLSQVRARVAEIEGRLITLRPASANTASSWSAAAAAAGLTSASAPTATAGGVVPTSASTSASVSPTAGAAIVAKAQEYLGVPYLWGGTDPNRGLDCSGFTQLVYASQGVDLPRVSSQQATAGTPVASLSEAQPGDLLFFDYSASRPGIDHVGIYMGGGQMMAAPQPGDVVKVQPAGQPTIIRRVLPQE